MTLYQQVGLGTLGKQTISPPGRPFSSLPNMSLFGSLLEFGAWFAPPFGFDLLVSLPSRPGSI